MTAAAHRLVVVAQIVGAFGVRGEVRIRSFTRDPSACFGYGPLLDAAGREVLRTKTFRPSGDGFIATPEPAAAREHWESMKGVRLHVPRDAFPEPDEDEVYVADLVGCAAFLVDETLYGVVRGVHNFGADDLIEVATEAGETAFLPFTRAVVPDIDLTRRRIRVAPPAADDPAVP